MLCCAVDIHINRIGRKSANLNCPTSFPARFSAVSATSQHGHSSFSHVSSFSDIAQSSIFNS